MTCCNCFHWSICSETRPNADASMCKQYIANDDVLCGSARKVIETELERLRDRSKRLSIELESCCRDYRDLEREVELLRIVKQTLEMQSGMMFDF